MGRSLGTGPTSDIAADSDYPVGACILQSPFLSAVRVVKHTPFTLPIDIFATQDKIHKIKAPLFIMHGTEDEVINFQHGEVSFGFVPFTFRLCLT
jgi:hypothetical protein